MRLKIDQVTPGMKLAEPITNASGVTLMPAGIRLTPMFIARIRKWNIEALDVLVDKPRPSDTAIRRAAAAKKDTATIRREHARDAAAPGARQQEDFARDIAGDISRSFVNVKNNELMMQLRAVVIRGLIAHGRHGVVNILRQPPGESPAPVREEPVADGS